jgi:hypothetical protein
MANPSLLGIPTELRLKILRNCMVIGVAEVAIRQPRFLECGWFQTPHASSQLLCVCKTLYNEGLPILYGENILCFYDALRLKIFLACCDDIKSTIKHIFMGCTCGIVSELSLFNSLPNLRSFHRFVYRESTFEVCLNGDPDLITRHPPPQTLIRRLSRKSLSQAIEIGVVLCFKSLTQVGNNLVSGVFWEHDEAASNFD